MQKKLLALAIAGLSSAAFAQSNVTIYGVADIGVENVKIDGQEAVGTVANVPSKMRATQNSSYIGFKGVEDLGNGLKAVFQFEQSVTFGANADNVGGSSNHIVGSSIFNGNARDSYVALAGGFGTVAIGTVTGPYRALGTMVSYAPGAAGVGYTGSIYGTIGGVKTTTDDRTTNAVAYISPAFNGFSAVVAYAANGNHNDAVSGTTDTTKDGKTWTLGLNYAAGGFTGGYAYLYSKDPGVLGLTFPAASAPANGSVAAVTTTLGAFLGAAATYNDKLTANRLAGKYDFGQGTTVTALWDKQKLEADWNGGGDKLERTAWQLGAGHKFGANTVSLEYAKAGKIKMNAGDVADTEAKQWTLGYTYDLSKRTQLKAYYTEVRNEATSAVNFYNNAVAGIAADGDVKSWGAAIRHNF